MKPHLASAWSLIALGSSLSLSAQTAPAPTRATGAQDDAVVLSPFVVDTRRDYGYRATNSMIASGIDAEIYKVPLNISVLTSEFMDDAGIDSIQAATAYLGGVNAEYATTGGPQFRVRGFTTNYTLENGYLRYRINYSDNIDRFEVVKGPLGVFFGRNPPGGIVNIATKRASFTPRQDVRLTYGSHDYKRVEFSSQGPVPRFGGSKLAYRVFANWLDKEDWRDFEFEQRDYVMAGLWWKPTNQLNLRLDYTYRYQRSIQATRIFGLNNQMFGDYANPSADLRTSLIARGLANTDNVATVARTRWAGLLGGSYFDDVAAARGAAARPGRIHQDNPELTPYGFEYNGSHKGSREIQKQNAVLLDGDWSPTKWLTLRAAGFYDSDKDDVRKLNIDLINGDGSANPSAQLGVPHHELLTTKLDALFNFQNTWSQTRLVTGFERRNEKLVSRNWAVAPGGDPLRILDATNVWRPFAEGYRDLRNVSFILREPTDILYQTTDGLYVNGLFSLRNPAVNLMVGARREKFKQEAKSTVATNPTKRFLRSSEATTPTAGINWEFKKGYVVFASFSESYVPNFGQRRIVPNGGTGSQLTADEQALPPLDDERGEGWDIGFKASTPDGKIVGTLSLFDAEYNQRIRRDTDQTNNDPRNLDANPNNNVTWNLTSGVERSRGWEGDFVWTPTRNYQATFSYTFLWEADVISNKNDVAQEGRRRGGVEGGAPKHKWGLWNSYTFTEGKLKGIRAGVGVNQYSALARTARIIDDYISPGGYLVDGMLGYTMKLFNRQTDFQVNVNNLLDERRINTDRDPLDPLKAQVRMTVRF